MRKKLCFILALAAVISVVPYGGMKADAAETNTVKWRYIGVKKSAAKAVDTKYLWAGGKRVNFDYSIDGITHGLSGQWKSSDPSVVFVDHTSGIAKAKRAGNALITFTSDDGRAVSVTVKSRVRASSLSITKDASAGIGGMPVYDTVAMKPGETQTFYIQPKIGIKQMLAGATASTYYVHHTEDAGLKVTNGAENGDYKGKHYGRQLTVTVPSDAAVGVKNIHLTANPYTDGRTSKYEVSKDLKIEVKVLEKEAVPIVVTQTGTNLITLKNVTETDGFTISNNVLYDIALDSKNMPMVSKNTDGTYNVTLKTRSTLAATVKYTVFDKKGKELGTFYGTVSEPDKVKLNGVYLGNDGYAYACVEITDKWGSRFTGNATVKANNVTGSDVSDFDPVTTADGIYYIKLGNAKLGDSLMMTVSAQSSTWSDQLTTTMPVTASPVNLKTSQIVVDGIYVNGIKATTLTKSSSAAAVVKFRYTGGGDPAFTAVLDNDGLALVKGTAGNFTLPLNELSGYDTVGNHELVLSYGDVKTTIKYMIAG